MWDVRVTERSPALPSGDRSRARSPDAAPPHATRATHTVPGLLALQRTAGNTAVSRAIATAGPLGVAAAGVTPAPGTSAVAVQRDGWLDNLKKSLAAEHRFRLGSYTLYEAHRGKDFPWSKKFPGDPAEARVPLGTIPLPPPVGPLIVEAGGSASAYVGGLASLNVRLVDITVVVSNQDLLELGAKAHVLMDPRVPVPIKLAILATTKFRGFATLVARANASLEAGARATLTAIANSAVWPVAPYLDGFIGGRGSIGAEALFEGPAEWEFSLGRLRLKDGQSFAAKGQVSLTPRIGFEAGLAIGMYAGYRPVLNKKLELWSHRVGLSAETTLRAGLVEGGGNPRLLTAGGEPPTVDLEPILIQGKALLQALFELRNAANDHVNPNPPSADSPGVPARGIGDIQKHGSKPPSNRTGPKILWTTSEHLMPFAVGKRLWEVLGLVVPIRGGHEDRGQTTIMIYFEAAEQKTADDRRMISDFEAKVAGSGAARRMERAKVLIDAGHPEQAKPEVRSVLGLMAAGLRTAREDAVARTNAAVVAESNLHLDGHPRTNAERRGPEGQPEDVTPLPVKVRQAADQQYADVFQLAQDAVEDANLLR
jgi:hypothetical protein